MTKQYKVDPRVKLLKYINKYGQEEKYPEIGFPVQAFISIEHENIKFFSNQNQAVSEYFLISSTQYRQELSLCLKSLLFCGLYNFIEYSSFCMKSSVYLINIYESNLGGMKIININLFNKNLNLKSNSNIFKSTVWLERETFDFFNLFHTGLSDTRKLMLDYSSKKGVMLSKTISKNNNNFNISENIQEVDISSNFIGNYFYC